MQATTSVEVVPDMGAALLTEAGMRDPYSVYRILRETDPVHWSPRLRAWLVTRHADVREVYKDHARFSSVGKDVENLRTLAEAERSCLPNVEVAEMTEGLDAADPPRHTRHRAPFNRALAPRALTKHHDALRELCERQVEHLASRDEPDLIRDFTTPLAYNAMYAAFGVSNADHTPVFERAWRARKDMVQTGATNIAESAARYEETLVAFREALESMYADHRDDDPEASFIASLLNPASDDRSLDEDEMFFLMARFFVAAHENVIYTNAHTVLALLQHPEQLDRVRTDPALTEAAYEEGTRWLVPGHMQKRVATHDFEFGGKPIQKGQMVYGFKASANRDPDFWDDPDRYDISRDARIGTMSWGLGIHFCVGASLARFLGPLALSSLLERFPDMRLPDGWTPAFRVRPMSTFLDEFPLALR